MAPGLNHSAGPPAPGNGSTCEGLKTQTFRLGFRPEAGLPQGNVQSPSHPSSSSLLPSSHSSAAASLGVGLMVRIIEHEIEQGESTAGIAGRFATKPEDILDHPDNADLKESTDPAVLPPAHR